MSFRGAIFDLDGVLVETVPLHFKAWKKLFGEYGKEFNFEDYKKKVDGIPRQDGAKAILSDLSEEELKKAATRKQDYFLEYIKTEGINVYPGSQGLLEEIRRFGIKVAVISSSKNCSLILEKAGLYPFIDVKVSGSDIVRGKPDPGIFLMALERLKLKPKECIVFEDALLGVEAARRAGIFTIGIDRYRSSRRLKQADFVVDDLDRLSYRRLKSLLAERQLP